MLEKVRNYPKQCGLRKDDLFNREVVHHAMQDECATDLLNYGVALKKVNMLAPTETGPEMLKQGLVLQGNYLAALAAAEQVGVHLIPNQAEITGLHLA